MRIPELCYPHDQDDYILRGAEIELGNIALDIQAITMAGKDRPNEDAFAFAQGVNPTPNLTVGVFDGAVSRDASHIAARLLEGSDHDSAATSLRAVNHHLAAYDLGGGASTGTIVRITPGIDSPEASLDVAHVTDSWAMAEFHDGTTELLSVDQHAPFDQAALDTLVRIAVRYGLDLATARQTPAVKAALASMFETVRNTPDGSGEGILNGDPMMDQYIHTASLPLAKVKQILIGSDGVRIPGSNEADPSYRAELLGMVGERGVAWTVDYIHNKEEQFPPTVDYPRWSKHDDKTLVSIQIAGL